MTLLEKVELVGGCAMLAAGGFYGSFRHDYAQGAYYVAIGAVAFVAAYRYHPAR